LDLVEMLISAECELGLMSHLGLHHVLHLSHSSILRDRIEVLMHAAFSD
jgi:hypothetical protein